MILKMWWPIRIAKFWLKPPEITHLAFGRRMKDHDNEEVTIMMCSPDAGIIYWAMHSNFADARKMVINMTTEIDKMEAFKLMGKDI